MSIIDTSQWGAFLIGDLFEIERPLARVLTGRAEGMIPFVSSGSSNNGVAGYVDALPGEHLDKGNCISVSAIDGASFWQPVDFLGRGGSGASILLLRRNDLNDLVGTFLAGVITASINASYTDLLTGRSLLATQVKLPVTPTGDPDWDVMEQTMREVTVRMATNLDALTALPADTTTGQIDTSQWGEFKVAELFERIERGKCGNVGALPDGETPYVKAGTAGNGYGRLVSDPDGHLTSEGNCVALICDAEVGQNTYQPAPFVGTVNLALGYHSRLNEMTGLFLVSALNQSTGVYGYSYAHKRNTGALQAEMVSLPVTPAGDPDWDAMEQTMRDVMAERKAALDSFQTLVDEV